MLKIGLAFAGADGAYQFGVWKAMKQEGIENNITAVSGSSAGVLNAALFLKGDDEVAKYIWERFGADTLTAESMAEMIDRYIEPEFFDNNKNCYIGSKVKREVLYYCLKELPLEGRREKMLDESAGDCVLLEPLYTQEKCDIIIAVHQKTEMDTYNLSRYRNAQIIEFISEDPEGEQDVQKRIEQGYQDSLNFFINLKQELNSEIENLLRVTSADDRKKVYQKIRQRRDDERFL